MKCDWKPSFNTAISTAVPAPGIEPEPDVVKQAQSESGIVTISKQEFYRGIFTLFTDLPEGEEDLEKREVRAYVLVYQNSDYLSARSELARRYTVFAFLFLAGFDFSHHASRLPLVFI